MNKQFLTKKMLEVFFVILLMLFEMLGVYAEKAVKIISMLVFCINIFI